MKKLSLTLGIVTFAAGIVMAGVQVGYQISCALILLGAVGIIFAGDCE